MFREVFYSKSHHWNRSHCRDRYLFFLPPKDGVKGGKQVYAYVLHVIHKRLPHPHNHCTRYNGKPQYRVQQYQTFRDDKEITPSGNSLGSLGNFRIAQCWRRFGITQASLVLLSPCSTFPSRIPFRYAENIPTESKGDTPFENPENIIIRIHKLRIITNLIVASVEWQTWKIWQKESRVYSVFEF